MGQDTPTTNLEMGRNKGHGEVLSTTMPTLRVAWDRQMEEITCQHQRSSDTSNTSLPSLPLLPRSPPVSPSLPPLLGSLLESAAAARRFFLLPVFLCASPSLLSPCWVWRKLASNGKRNAVRRPAGQRALARRSASAEPLARRCALCSHRGWHQQKR